MQLKDHELRVQLKKPKSRMHPKQHKSIRNQLAIATCSVIAGVASNAHAQEAGSLRQEPWEIDSAVLIYIEPKRVMAIEPVIRARKKIGEEEFLNLRLVIDSLTGSSANGATPTSTPQTFTTPSGAATYTAPANETPLDTSFLDTRVALNAEWEKPLTDNLRGQFSANASKEYDYTSLGIAATLAHDFNRRNTTLTAGLSYNADTVDPVGGAPLGLARMPTTAPSSKPTIGASLSKKVTEMLIGITQVISRNTLMQFNLSYGKDDGYMTDPYKILSMVDGVTGNTNSYVYEKRPEQRTRQSLYWKTQHQFTQDVLTTVYRYYWDEWGSKSHTLDLRHRWEFSSKNYLQPHLRFYRQGAADFYRHSLITGQPLPQFATADYRLGDMTSITYGLKYGIPLGNKEEFSVRVEFMNQSGENHPADAIGSQRQQDLFGGTDAFILQAGYSFLF